MKGQNFTFSSKFGSIYVGKIRTGDKYFTNRNFTPHRDKMIPKESMMHCFLDLRTPTSEKLFDVILDKKLYWNNDEPPLDKIMACGMPSIIPNLSWFEFSQIDGFETYKKFLDFFNIMEAKRFPKQFKKLMICFVWNPNERIFND